MRRNHVPRFFASFSSFSSSPCVSSFVVSPVVFLFCFFLLLVFPHLLIIQCACFLTQLLLMWVWFTVYWTSVSLRSEISVIMSQSFEMFVLSRVDDM